jgi:hypothetical protein
MPTISTILSIVTILTNFNIIIRVMLAEVIVVLVVSLRSTFTAGLFLLIPVGITIVKIITRVATALLTATLTFASASAPAVAVAAIAVAPAVVAAIVCTSTPSPFLLLSLCRTQPHVTRFPITVITRGNGHTPPLILLCRLTLSTPLQTLFKISGLKIVIIVIATMCSFIRIVVSGFVGRVIRMPVGYLSHLTCALFGGR